MGKSLFPIQNIRNITLRILGRIVKWKGAIPLASCPPVQTEKRFATRVGRGREGVERKGSLGEKDELGLHPIEDLDRQECWVVIEK